VRTAVITGGGSGIGFGVARVLARRGGWRLIVAGRTLERLEEAAERIGATPVACDVREDGDVARLALTAEEQGGCDLLVQSAGIPARRDVLEAAPEEYRDVLETNAVSLVRVTRALWPQLVERRGRIANVVSVAGTVAQARGMPYAVSKHAALAYSRGLCAVARGEGVTVTTVNPGPVQTEGFTQAALRKRRFVRHVVIDVDRAAEALVRGVDRGAPEIYVPFWWRTAAIFQAVLPGTTAAVAARVWNPHRTGQAAH
jgi:short-subunit dehydrogenase